jgi:hypothetical protein
MAFQIAALMAERDNLRQKLEQMMNSQRPDGAFRASADDA